MMPTVSRDDDTEGEFRIVRRIGHRLFCRGWDSGVGHQVALADVLKSEPASPDSNSRLEYEFGLRGELDPGWALRPLDLIREQGKSVLLLEDHEGLFLDQILAGPMEMATFLALATSLAEAIGRLHNQGLIHKDIKPGNILVNLESNQVWLTGFGIASRLLRERPQPNPADIIVGTLAYMAPEQTGRMNRSIDSRTDLYALGVTLYEMLTGTLPFTASEPMEWVHCHIARRAPPITDRLPSAPAPVAAIVMKLLAKTAEERYQTAAGVAADLRSCALAWQTQGCVNDFPLCSHDSCGRLLIPEKLYGRTEEVAKMIDAFDRVVATGKPELVLVSGYAGIGKSSLVNEIHKVLVQPRGLFAAGKFDQYTRDVPYSTLTHALASLVHMLLGKNEAELASWREALTDALGLNGLLMVRLIPDLALIVGPQPNLPDLPAQDAQRRFQLVFRRFIAVFARAEHPLALFVDDLQWLDAATLDLLEDLLVRNDVSHLLLIGAYRDNEVDAAHPLARKLEVIRRTTASVLDIKLRPLARKDIEWLVADSLRCEPEYSKHLAHLIHGKTAGNPYFVIQFLHALADATLLRYDHDLERWVWDLDRIHAEGYTDNVADLMTAKLRRLPVEARNAVKTLSCIGDSVEFPTLALASDATEEDVHTSLWEAVQLELIVRFDDAYKFAHDRVREAAYSLIPEDLRVETHLRIGRLMKTQFSPDMRDDALFEIVSQLNRGIELIVLDNERIELASLNLIAGRRAKSSTAYVSALRYFSTGTTLLGNSGWENNYELMFPLELNRAECEFLTGQLQDAEKRLAELSRRAASTIEQAAVASSRVDLYTTLNRSDRAVDVCLEYLRGGGVDWPARPTDAEGQREYRRIFEQLNGQPIEAIVDLPLMQAPNSLATLDVLTKTFPAALFTDARLLSLAACRAVNLSLENGNCDSSCVAYVWLGMIAGPHFGDYEAGFRFGQLGYELVEKQGLDRFKARTYLWFGQFVVPWTKHVTASRELFRRAFDAANKVGDLTVAAYSCNNLNTNLLAAGDPLSDAEREAENGLKFARKACFGFVIDIVTAQIGLIRTLRGLTPNFGTFDEEHFDETQFEQHLSNEPSLALPECWYWTRKLQARFFAGDYEGSIAAATNAQRLLWTSPSIFESAEYHFFSAMALAASCAYPDEIPLTSERSAMLEAHRQQLQIWSDNCPANFSNRVALVNAEIARLAKRPMDAMRLYEEAIRSANSHGFVHHEALANEFAARFYDGLGFKTVARTYLREARMGYLRWEALGKVRHLDRLYPHFGEEEYAPDERSTILAPIERIDLATVIKVSQAISGEMVRERLIQLLMRTALEHAGAVHGVLILLGGREQRIVADIDGDSGEVCVRETEIGETVLPESVLQYTMRTQDNVVIGDAMAERHPFSDDPYLRRHSARSIICVPLTNQAKLTGALYLENNLCPHVFTLTRVTTLRLLASQAATSLENTILYADLEEREAKIRRLVDANIIGIIIFNMEGGIVEANDAFLQMVGFDRTELTSGLVSWDDLTPPEWRENTKVAVAEMRETGAYRPREKEYFCRDGSRIPVLVGGAAFGARREQGVAFVVDLTERKRAEKEMRDSEQRYHDIQMNLVHLNRIETVGQLSASIAHEIRQPISAALTNARAALRWMSASPPNLDEVRAALDRIVVNGNRAGDVVSRIHALVKKTPPAQDHVDLNEAIHEVIALSETEAARHSVRVFTSFSAEINAISGDRVQIQQVILNLIANAIEAMVPVSHRARTLSIRTAPEEPDSVSISIVDSGPGFSEQQLEHIFEAFYTTKPNGLGVGLSICRSIVEAHGGKLSAQCAGREGGAKFVIVLPAHR